MHTNKMKNIRHFPSVLIFSDPQLIALSICVATKLKSERIRLNVRESNIVRNVLNNNYLRSKDMVNDVQTEESKAVTRCLLRSDR